MQSQKLDIVELIEQNPITRLSKNYQSKFLEKIQKNFTEYQQQLFVSSFYSWLNYNSKTDFVIELEYIWKWLGFSRKEHCKVVLLKHFTQEIDYKIFATEVAEAKILYTNLAYENKNVETRGGHNKEKILMTINTFKKLCLKTNTKKADEIHDYFIKLEEISHETVNEESIELRKQLEEKENTLQLLELNNQQKDHKIHLLTRKTDKHEEGESVYIHENN